MSELSAKFLERCVGICLCPVFAIKEHHGECQINKMEGPSADIPTHASPFNPVVRKNTLTRCLRLPRSQLTTSKLESLYFLRPLGL